MNARKPMMRSRLRVSLTRQPPAEAIRCIVSDEELANRAKALATAGPLSELVIAEREGGR